MPRQARLDISGTLKPERQQESSHHKESLYQLLQKLTGKIWAQIFTDEHRLKKYIHRPLATLVRDTEYAEMNFPLALSIDFESPHQ